MDFDTFKTIVKLAHGDILASHRAVGLYEGYMMGDLPKCFVEHFEKWQICTKYGLVVRMNQTFLEYDMFWSNNVDDDYTYLQIAEHSKNLMVQDAYRAIWNI